MLEDARVNGQRARGRSGLSRLVDYQDANAESRKPQGENEARGTRTDDEHVSIAVDCAHLRRAGGRPRVLATTFARAGTSRLVRGGGALGRPLGLYCFLRRGGTLRSPATASGRARLCGKRRL